MKTRFWNQEVCAALRRTFSYNPRTGIVSRRHATSSVAPAGPINTKTEGGYLRASLVFSGFRFRIGVHRLAYFLRTGEQPEFIDHEDGNPSNNRFDNLRATSSSGNNRNRRKKVGCHQDLPPGIIRITIRKKYVYYYSTIRTPGRRFSRTSKSLETVLKWRRTMTRSFFGKFAAPVKVWQSPTESALREAV